MVCVVVVGTTKVYSLFSPLAIRRATIPIFYDMMENEWKYKKNFHFVSVKGEVEWFLSCEGGSRWFVGCEGGSGWFVGCEGGSGSCGGEKWIV